jgi:2-keto-3-deoxy-6-phosphogluconate aldolase
VAIFRAPEARHFEQASDVLCDAGVTCHEYTLTTEGALAALVGAGRRLEGAVLWLTSRYERSS